ncbi:hypothetical protein KMZ30_07375 [Phycicoccus sp. KQZ13P-1]|uniref:hypothetical protein n=1 Tax=Phycicoccus mangrovi TaxID=2840470 RepID=UPI001C006F20|nr:hypothetical protein [Phycicoccus mangrovi]MBT9255392.1 hypothetical protein [Phycicoccus mangrovi]
MSNTTSTGTTITVEDAHGDRVVILSNPNVDVQRVEAGRLILGGFQPAALSVIGYTPETLRIIADLAEQEARS